MKPKNISFYTIHTCACTHTTLYLLIHLLIGTWVASCLLVIENAAAVNKGVHVCLHFSAFDSFEIHQEADLLVGSGV